MSHFLWIEDFESDIRATVDQVFGLADAPDSLQELKGWLEEQRVTLKTTFFDALRFVRDPARLGAVDYVVIDIDLKPYEDYDLDDPDSVAEIDGYLREKGYLGASPDTAAPLGPVWRTAVSELKKVAGYHIFTELLIESGFPKRHILFCSNHGDQLTSITHAFAAAKLHPPGHLYQARSAGPAVDPGQTRGCLFGPAPRHPLGMRRRRGVDGPGGRVRDWCFRAFSSGRTSRNGRLDRPAPPMCAIIWEV